MLRIHQMLKMAECPSSRPLIFLNFFSIFRASLSSFRGVRRRVSYPLDKKVFQIYKDDLVSDNMNVYVCEFVIILTKLSSILRYCKVWFDQQIWQLFQLMIDLQEWRLAHLLPTTSYGHDELSYVHQKARREKAMLFSILYDAFRKT